MKRRPQIEAMRGDVPGVAWPPVFSTRSSALVTMVEGFERSQWLPTKVIAAGQRRQLALLARHYAVHSAWFRGRLDSAGLTPDQLGEPGALQRLPLLERREAQAMFADVHVSALPPGHTPLRRVNTSGSTGEPVIVWKTMINRFHWLAMTLRYYFWQEPDFSARLAVIRALLEVFGEAPNWGPPMSELFETGPILRIDIEEDLNRQIALIRKFGAQSLLIYPSNLGAMLDILERTKKKLPKLKRIRTLGETVSDDLRDRTEALLGIRLKDCYSTEEVGYVAIECPEHRTYHIMSETMIVEIIDADGQTCKPGRSGRVVVTDLHNHATPMIRYVTGDYAEAGPPCKCGRGLPTLRRILGRERNMITKPDGTRHWPLTGYKVFREIAPILQYQFIQHTIDRIEIRLVAERPVTAAEEARLTAYLQEKLRHTFQLDYVYFEGRLPPGPNGKFEEFLSLL